MIADVRVVMAGAAKTRKRLSKYVIDASNTRDVDCRGVENRLSARDRLTIYLNGAFTGRATPSQG